MAVKSAGGKLGCLGMSGERYVMPFDAGYISYIMITMLGVACGLEGVRRPAIRDESSRSSVL